MTISKGLRRESITDQNEKNEGDLYYEQVIFAFFFIFRHCKVSLVSLPSVRNILFSQEDSSLLGPFKNMEKRIASKLFRGYYCGRA